MYLFKFHKSVSLPGCNCRLQRAAAAAVPGELHHKCFEGRPAWAQALGAACWGKGWAGMCGWKGSATRLRLLSALLIGNAGSCRPARCLPCPAKTSWLWFSHELHLVIALFNLQCCGCRRLL